MLFAIFVFFIFFLLVTSGLLIMFYRQPVLRRLASVIESSDGPRIDRETKAERFGSAFHALAEKIQKAFPKGANEVSVTQKRLVLAGYRRDAHLNALYASKVLLPLSLCVLALVTGLYQWQPIVVFLGAIAVGYLAPDYVVSYLMSERRTQLSEGLPDALDLMVVCLEAGLSLDQSVLLTSDEIASGHPAVADELGLVMLEVRAGKTRVDAWKALLDRTDLDEIRVLVSIIVQADQFGTGVSKTLRVHTETMRMRRSQRVEELAAKTSVKLVFPLVLLIFPSLFVVVLGPAVIQIAKAFKDMH